MGRWTVLTVLVGLSAAVLPALAQDGPSDRDGERVQRPSAAPPAGFWPSRRMVELVIDRVTERAGRVYGFDEDQLTQTRALIKERLPAWLEEHRGQIMQVTNDYLEAVLDREAPEPAWVAGWAQRVLPLVDEFNEVVEGLTADMRPLMTDEQQVRLDGTLAAWRVGTNYLTQRLGGWCEGGFDPVTDWYRNPEFRPAEERRMQEVRSAQAQARQEAQGGAVLAAAPAMTPARAAGEKPRASASATVAANDEWAQYVAEFIRRYQLNEDQRASAYKHLKNAQEQRAVYLRRNEERLNEAEARLKAAENDERRIKAQAQVHELRKPLERMFDVLKGRLDQIPTRKQRVAAAQAELESRAKVGATDAGGAPPSESAKEGDGRSR